MQNQVISKQPVLLQLPSGLYLGLVCFNPQFENLKFVLEKREFFEMEWPAIVVNQERGLMPLLVGTPNFTIQRSQIIWYTTYIPAELLNHYQAYLPMHQKPNLPSEKKPQTKITSSKGDKIIPFPSKEDRKE